MSLETSIAAEIVPESDWQDASFRARFQTLYLQLRTLARRELRRVARGTLDTTVLVHEAFLRLDPRACDASSRQHFMAVAAKAMRCVLVDHARARHAQKRGGDQGPVSLVTDIAEDASGSGIDILDIERSLRALEALEPRLATIVEYRFYAGMEFVEIAHLLDVTPRTINRDWRRARAFLLTHLRDAA